jgi:hypothetical protein
LAIVLITVAAAFAAFFIRYPAMAGTEPFVMNQRSPVLRLIKFMMHLRL